MSIFEFSEEFMRHCETSPIKEFRRGFRMSYDQEVMHIEHGRDTVFPIFNLKYVATVF